MLEAHIKIIEKEPKTFQNFGVLKVLAQENNDEESVKSKDEPPATEALKLNDDDQKLFFEEFSDSAESNNKKNESEDNKQQQEQQQQEKSSDDNKLIDYDDGFDEFMSASSSVLLPSQLLMDDSFSNNPTNVDLLGSLVPSQASDSLSLKDSLSKNASKKSNDVSKWFQLFSELDPFNQQNEVNDASEKMHAA